ncbi:MAG: hypothetical protein R3B60_02705 [Candidatus Paceibacterota bacterium]
MAVSQEVKDFKNPSGYWKHDGSFSVELVPDADKSMVPTSAEIRGDTVHVCHGRIKQTMGSIQLYSYESQFCWGYPRIKVIRDGQGKLLWVNYNYR